MTGDAYLRSSTPASGSASSDPTDFENRFAVAATLQIGYFLNREIEVSISPQLAGALVR